MVLELLYALLVLVEPSPNNQSVGTEDRIRYGLDQHEICFPCFDCF